MLNCDHSRAPATLLIGSDALLAAWERYAAKAPQVVALVHTDIERAMQVIDETDAQVIIIELAVARTEPGAAVMVQIHNQRTWRGTEIRLLPDEVVYTLMATEPGDANPQDWLTEMARPLPPRPQRRAPRVRAAGDEEVSINGRAAALVDWSATGAQVRSEAMLRPNQRVRVTLSKADKVVKTRGVVAWCTFTVSPRPEYRAGIALADTITDLVQHTSELLVPSHKAATAPTAAA